MNKKKKVVIWHVYGEYWFLIYDFYAIFGKFNNYLHIKKEEINIKGIGFKRNLNKRTFLLKKQF